MNMDINETWNYQTIMQFNDGSAFTGKGGGNGNNTALVNGNIHILELSVPENGPAGQQQTHVGSPSSLIHSTYYIIGKRRPCQPLFSGKGHKKSEAERLLFGIRKSAPPPGGGRTLFALSCGSRGCRSDAPRSRDRRRCGPRRRDGGRRWRLRRRSGCRSAARPPARRRHRCSRRRA